MPTLDVLLLPVWQEVCRHLELADLADSIADLLREHVPLTSLIFRRLETEHRRVRIIATSVADATPAEPGDVHLADAEWKRLERWVRGRKPAHLAAERRQTQTVLELLDQPTPTVDMLLTPLIGEHGSQGILSTLAAEG